MAGSYAEKLKDPRWQKVRLKILERDSWACTRCGTTKLTLHVHHEQYRGDPWEADPTFLKTVCESCHDAEHAVATVIIVERSGRSFEVSTKRARMFAAELIRACNEMDAAVGPPTPNSHS